jgi:citrate lyase beta subunit
MPTERRRSARRTYIECPTMDERKWGKVPGIPADVFLADMEDSVAPALKEGAREKVAGLCRDPSFFEGREFICRPNNIFTPWGLADLEALAAADAPFVLYPKARSAAEVREVQAIFERAGASPEIQVIVETPEAVLRLEEIAACPGVGGFLFGPGDLSMETGISLLDGDSFFAEGFLYARSKTLMTARAFGLEATEGIFIANLKDGDELRRAAERSMKFGFSGNMLIYPPHVPVVNEVRTPSEKKLARARQLVKEYEAAREEGKNAVTLESGEWVTVHQYKGALELLEQVGATA